MGVGAEISDRLSHMERGTNNVSNVQVTRAPYWKGNKCR